MKTLGLQLKPSKFPMLSLCYSSPLSISSSAVSLSSARLTLISTEAEPFAKRLTSHNKLNFWPSQVFLPTLSLFAVPANRLLQV